ncbi:MAG TPA: hypothetical protein VGG28_20800 [Kofleriaceae bacterium]
MKRAFAAVVLLACHRAPQATLPPAGDERDDGAGLLARASVQVVLDEGSDEAPTESARHRHHSHDGDDDDDDDDGEYGGTSYANWHPAAAAASTQPHAPRYTVVASDLDGSIDGVVTWTGALPHLPCGAGMRLGADRGVRGAAVYIERITEGRAFPAYAQTEQVGGTLTKRGCALTPTVQVVAPVPATLAIRGDGDATHVRATGTTASDFDLQAGGTAAIELAPGVTRLEGSGGGRAWAIGVETPYVAITDDDGHFRIDELPAAVYDVTIFSAPASLNGAPIVTHRSVRVGSGATKLAVALH